MNRLALVLVDDATNVEETLNQILNKSKLSLQYVNSIVLDVTSKRNKSGGYTQDSAYQSMKNDLASKMNDCLQNLLDARLSFQVLINVTDNLLNKFTGEKRLSVPSDHQILNGVFQKTDDQQFIGKFEFIINRLMDLWRCVMEFEKQLDALLQNGMLSDDDHVTTSYFSQLKPLPVALCNYIHSRILFALKRVLNH